MLDSEETLEDAQYYNCEVTQYDMKRNFDDIVAVGANVTTFSILECEAMSWAISAARPSSR